ncbi:MAG: hypothetical protein SFU91_07980 [Chloroherpetonaceae bacterium]|nr:hypothetical protein [Chloroherpetonaceae bacterium]
MSSQENRSLKRRRRSWFSKRFPVRLPASQTGFLLLLILLILGTTYFWFKSLVDSALLNAATSHKPSLESLSYLPDDTLKAILEIQSLFSDYSRDAIASNEAREVWIYIGSSASFHNDELTQLINCLERVFPQKNEVWVECFPVSKQLQSERYLGFNGRWVKKKVPSNSTLTFFSIDEIETSDLNASIFDKDEKNIRSLSANRLAYFYFAYATSTTKARLYGEKLTSEFEIASNHELMEFLKWRGVLYEVEGIGFRRKIDCNPDSLRKLPLPSLHLLSQRFSAPTFEDEISFQPKDYLSIRRSLALNIERILSEEIPID